jgi:MFS superfamily sulfate permease-like transporter
MAAHGRLILTSMLFAALLVGTQGFDAIPGAVLAAVAAWITGSALDRQRTTTPAAGPREPASA